MSDLGHDRVKRNGDRRRSDRMRKLGEKALAAGFTIVTAIAIYYWNESREALRDIANSKTAIEVIRADLVSVKSKVDSAEGRSETQRMEIRQDINRVEQKVERLIELYRRAQ